MINLAPEKEPVFAEAARVLRPGGRLGVIVRDGPAGRARIYTRGDDGVADRVAFDAAPPLAPGLERLPSFQF